MLVCRGQDIQHTCIYPYRSARARCTAALRSLRWGQSVTWATFILCDEVRCYKEAGQVCERLAAKNGNSRPSWLRKARPCQATIEDPPDTPKHSKSIDRPLHSTRVVVTMWSSCKSWNNCANGRLNLESGSRGTLIFFSAKIPKLMMADSDKCNVKVERWKQLQVHISSH